MMFSILAMDLSVPNGLLYYCAGRAFVLCCTYTPLVDTCWFFGDKVGSLDEMFDCLLDALSMPCSINLALLFMCLLQFLESVVLPRSATFDMDGLACSLCFDESLSICCLCRTMPTSISLFVDIPGTTGLTSL